MPFLLVGCCLPALHLAFVCLFAHRIPFNKAFERKASITFHPTTVSTGTLGWL